MKRRTKGILLVGSLLVATGVASVLVLAGAVARTLDPQHHCETGFSTLVGCTYAWSSTTSGQSTPIFPVISPQPFQPAYIDVTLWAVAHCPWNAISRRLLCATPAVASPAEIANGEVAKGLPLPMPWLVKTVKSSPFIEAIHVETPLALAAVLDFYRVELGKRGWTESGGAIVEPNRAMIAFTTIVGPAQLRLIHQEGRTIADLSLRKPATTKPVSLPTPGRARLLLGNATHEEAVITINEQTMKFAADAGRDLTSEPRARRKSQDSPEMNLPPGKYKASVKIASGTVQSREFEFAADETWGLLVGRGGVPLPVRLH
jgi:hypothetical protein